MKFWAAFPPVFLPRRAEFFTFSTHKCNFSLSFFTFHFSLFTFHFSLFTFHFSHFGAEFLLRWSGNTLLLEQSGARGSVGSVLGYAGLLPLNLSTAVECKVQSAKCSFKLSRLLKMSPNFLQIIETFSRFFSTLHFALCTPLRAPRTRKTHPLRGLFLAVER